MRRILGQLLGVDKPAAIELAAKGVVVELPAQVVIVQDRCGGVDRPEPLPDLVDPGMHVVVASNVNLVAQCGLRRHDQQERGDDSRANPRAARWKPVIDICDGPRHQEGTQWGKGQGVAIPGRYHEHDVQREPAQCQEHEDHIDAPPLAHDHQRHGQYHHQEQPIGRQRAQKRQPFKRA